MPPFSCKLQCKKCRFPGCPKTTCIGLPFCPVHSRQVLHLRLKKSKTHGIGVFAAGPAGSIVFGKGAFITMFGGELLTPGQIKKRYGDTDGPYIGHVTGKKARDGACLRFAGSMVNHAPKSKANTKYRVLKNDLMLVAKRPIKANEELTVDYGYSSTWFPKTVPHKTTKTRFTWV